MKVIYAFTKEGREADYWTREIGQTAVEDLTIVPFNFRKYLDPQLYIRAQLLDNLHYAENAGLAALQKDTVELIRTTRADAIIVDTCPPYHPEFLRKLDIYKVLRTSDGPLTAYDRDFAYVHAYDHVLYHSPAYSPDLTMAEKLLFCGARRVDLWPMAVFDAAYDATLTEEAIRCRQRDVDVLFVGALHLNKMPILAKVKKALGSKCRLHGLTNLKRNVYFNLKYGFPGWPRPIAPDAYVGLYQRTKIGFNVHNRGKYTVGGFRLFDLPANGVMQISDGGEYLQSFFEPGREVIGYDYAEELIEKIFYYLEHENERIDIAIAGFRRAMQEHRMPTRMQQLRCILEVGMNK